MSDPILEIRGLKKYFPVTKGVVFSKTTGWVKAVDGIDLTVRRGETLGLVGESGCGKTTTARVVLLMDAQTEGAVLYDGKDVRTFSKSDLAAYRRGVQAVFQNPFSSLDPRMPVGKIVSEPLRVGASMTSGEMRERVREVLEAVGIDPAAADKYPREFSGGQRQRIAIARALSSKPLLIVLDEPVSSQDVSIRAQLLNLLKDLQASLGVAYLLIAHDLASVRYMSQRIGVMYLGRIVEAASSEEVYTQPLHPYSRALLLASLPDHPDSRRAKNPLKGEVPSALNPPSGCHFHERCPDAKDACAELSPVLKEVEPGHSVACLQFS